MKDWRIAPPDNLSDGLGIGDGTKLTTESVVKAIMELQQNADCINVSWLTQVITQLLEHGS